MDSKYSILCHNYWVLGLMSAACAATVYFWMMKGIQTPLVEVLMFLCWAFIPYYICDGIEWSGIVSIVTAGFFMDIYVVGSRAEGKEESGTISQSRSDCSSGLKAVFSQEGFLSSKAKNHIGFVTEINSTLMETAIFAYLGIFLFSNRYHWSFWLPTMAIIACIVSRTIMVGSLSLVANVLTRVGRRTLRRACSDGRNESSSSSISHCTKSSVFIDSRMQLVLIFAGLRGAMSFALVETIPMYDEDAGQGTRLKPELKAMTSASIVFTVFVFGGYTFYLLEQLGISVGKPSEENVEMASLLVRKTSAVDTNEFFGDEMKFDVEADAQSPDILTQRHSYK